MLERLQAMHLVECGDVIGLGPCVALTAGGNFEDLDDARLKARLTTEKILLLAVRDCARKLGIGSYEKIALRDDAGGPPRVGTFAWDLTGPSYLRAWSAGRLMASRSPAFSFVM